MKKPHIVCVSFPAQGHVMPFLQLAKLLHSRSFYITFVNMEFNHNRFIKNKGSDSAVGLPDFIFETIPDRLLYSNKDTTQDVAPLCASTKKTCLGRYKELLAKLNSIGDAPLMSLCDIRRHHELWGLKNMRKKDIPNFVKLTASDQDIMNDFLGEEPHACLESSTIMFNNFDALE
ncbi:Linamarin synthase 1-like protein [Drosera capensis]